MDPNAALDVLRQWADEVIEYAERANPGELDAAQALKDLDRWLSSGGFKPADWR